MKNKKKIKVLILSAFVLGFAATPSMVKATDDRWGYGFNIQPYQANSHSAQRYRETTNPNNPWKVALESSGEGAGSITTFWLEVLSGANVSASVNVKQGAGAYYNGAYTNANQANVRLTGQNNNYNSSAYYISGHWDEETW